MKIYLIFFFLFPITVFAEIFEVHSVARKESHRDTWIVKFMDGRVGFWEQEEDPDLDPMKLQRSIIDAQLSATLVLTDIRIVGHLTDEQVATTEKVLEEPPYTPTIYPSYKFATEVLRRLRTRWTNDSQCYDKSHVWTYEEAYAGRFLQKAFIFFSDAYIGRYNFPWWFHTAPYALVSLNGETVERMMDPTFNKYPLKMKLWTDLFMRNKSECKLISKYTEYSTHPGEDDCYIMKSSMYFWQPKDLEAYERTGVEKLKFIEWEIKHAYKNGFGINL